MKSIVRKILLWTLLAVLLAGLFALCKLSGARRQALTCHSLRVEFADSCRFVTESDVKNRLDQLYGAYIGQRIDSVDLCKIEKILNETSAVKGTEAYMTDDGVLNITITQRRPAILFQRDSYGFYADDRGYIFPMLGNQKYDVPVVSGAIPINCPVGYKGRPAPGKQEKWMNDILAMTSYMKKHYALDKRIAEMKVQPDGNLVLKAKNGRETFIFGSPDGYAEKFEKMNIYEKSIKDTLKSYKSVNLMYKKQIVCK